MDIRTTLADDELHRKVNQWKGARASGSAATAQQLLDEVRAEILTERAAL
jgi:predicted AAA+ superfamily ATPase